MHNPPIATAAAAPQQATLAAAPSQQATFVARPDLPPAAPEPTGLPPECCVHIKTETLGGISASTPGEGRTDCPSRPDFHEKEVQIIEVRPDGNGGLEALIRADWMAAGSSSSAAPPGRVWPVCTAGPQKDEPVECCILVNADGTPIVACQDPNSPIHGATAEEAVAAGYTLETCPPPPEIDDCCVEIGQFTDESGQTFNAKIDCDDETKPHHGKLINVEVSEDGTEAYIAVGDTVTVTIPVCITEEVPEEIPCCIRDNKLFCPDEPDYHGMSVQEAQRKGIQLEDCPEEPPGEEPPPDCCVQLQEDGTAVLVCGTDPSGAISPYDGYVLKPGEFECQETPQGIICTVTVGAPAMTTSAVPPRQYRFPVCETPPPEPLPPDCCYDLALGELKCTDEGSEWHGLKVSLENLQNENGSMVAVVSHAMLGSAPVAFPVCEEQIPDDCCFDAQGDELGAVGKLVCPSTPALNGMEAVLTAVNEGAGGIPIATVSWAGGGARLPFCRLPEDETPECPPPYFCCVNLDTGLFVCPANPERDGMAADIAEVVDFRGLPWVRLTDRQMVPACGSECPAPEPCPPCPEGEECPACPEPEPCPPCPEGEECPPPEECSQPPWGEFPRHPVGHVPKSPSCWTQGC